ncbi:MAG: hypothetical protein ACOYK9_02505 [Chlamydiia bacterium]
MSSVLECSRTVAAVETGEPIGEKRRILGKPKVTRVVTQTLSGTAPLTMEGSKDAGASAASGKKAIGSKKPTVLTKEAGESSKVSVLPKRNSSIQSKVSLALYQGASGIVAIAGALVTIAASILKQPFVLPVGVSLGVVGVGAIYMTRKLQELKVDNHIIQRKIELSAEERSRVVAENVTLQSTIARLTREKATSTEGLSPLQERLSHLAAENDTLQSTIATLTREKAAATGELNPLQERVSHLIPKNIELTDEIEALGVSYSELAKKYSQALEDLRTVGILTKEDQSLREELEREFTYLSSSYQRLKEQFDTLKEDHQATTAELKSKEGVILHLEAQVQQLKEGPLHTEALRDLEKGHEELEEKYKNLLEHSTKIDLNFTDLKHVNESLKQELQLVKWELEVAPSKDAIEAHTETIRKLQSELAENEAGNQTLLAAVANLKESQAELTGELTEALRAKEVAESHVQRLTQLAAASEPQLAVANGGKSKNRKGAKH